MSEMIMSSCSLIVFDPEKKQEIISQMQIMKNVKNQSPPVANNQETIENIIDIENINSPNQAAIANTPKILLNDETPKVKKVRKSQCLTAEQEASGPYLSTLKAMQSNEKTKQVTPLNPNQNQNE